MQALVFIQSNGDYSFSDTVDYLTKYRNRLVALTKEIAKRGESAELELEIGYTTHNILLTVRFAKEVDRSIVSFLMERIEGECAYFVLDAAELEEN